MFDKISFGLGEVRWIGYNGRERLSLIVEDKGDNVLTVDLGLTETSENPVYKTFKKINITSDKKAADLHDEVTRELVKYAKNRVL
jgi:hypothetical protein